MSERQIWGWLERIEKAGRGAVRATYSRVRRHPWRISDGMRASECDTPGEAEIVAREWPAAMRDA
jgi:hypothetical protein